MNAYNRTEHFLSYNHVYLVLVGGHEIELVNSVLEEYPDLYGIV